MKRQESAENYLETIFRLARKQGTVRAVDIARELGFSKPSVSVALRHLKEKNFVAVGEDGRIVLSEAGHAMAQKVDGRHRLLVEFLCFLGVPREIAEEDACRLEHDLSDTTYACLHTFMQAQTKE